MPLDTFPKTPFIQTFALTKFAFMSNYEFIECANGTP